MTPDPPTLHPRARESPLVRAFTARTLPHAEWTHEAHLEVCWFAVQRRGAGALDHLRDEIRSYNRAVGTANTDTSGYHETITAFYVGAVAHVASRPGAELADALTDPVCERGAPLRHWRRETLMSVPARRAWLPPDLAPLPWHDRPVDR